MVSPKVVTLLMAFSGYANAATCSSRAVDRDERCGFPTAAAQAPEAWGQSMLQTQFKREFPSETQATPTLPHLAPNSTLTKVMDRSFAVSTIFGPMRLDSASPLVSGGATNKTLQCPLPAGAKWCEVHLHGLPSYQMAVYDDTVKPDVVSREVCRQGFWEENNMTTFGTPGHMLDIGGNIGYFTFAFAKAGWTVTSFEPMQPNLELIGATLCQNPNLAPRIRLNSFGLGTASKACKMMSPRANVGDGFVRCADEQTMHPMMHDEDSFVEIGQFSIRRLDEVLLEQAVSKVDFVKIDVEGYESQVFAGAPNFLAQYHPRIIRSEVWLRMTGASDMTPQNSFDPLVGSSGAAFLDSFTNAGYKFFEDGKCSVAYDAKAMLMQNNAVDLYMCL